MLFGACGAVGEARNAAPCPDFDPQHLVDLALSGPGVEAMSESWNTEADRYVGLCTDDVTSTLHDAGISYTVDGPGGKRTEQLIDGSPRLVQLLSDGSFVVAALMS
ncbi:MAG: hypothetical protein R2710_16945 [Acidimicrobiales bacterium]